MTQRHDLYGECNTVGAPTEVFTEQCCRHCINPECTRSAFGKTKFDQRIGTWYDRLFAHVPRMDQMDPRFEGIAAQRFMLINPSLTINSTASWVDPRDLSDQVVVQDPPVLPEPVREASAPAQPTPKAAPELPEPTVSQPSTGRLPTNLVTANTAVQQGRMLQPPPGAPKPSNSWDAPVPTTDTDGVKVVKSGARVKLGG
jgi:hypothetical protein